MHKKSSRCKVNHGLCRVERYQRHYVRTGWKTWEGLTNGISRARHAEAPWYRPNKPKDRITCIAPFLGAFGPSIFAISPISWRRILMISRGLVTICGCREPGTCRCLASELSFCYGFTYDLTTTSGTTSNQFPEQRNPASLRIHRFRPNKVVDGQF
jgi:hypothetical protein